MKYYAVMVNAQGWTKETVSVEDFKSRGYTVKPSRRVGDFQVFKDGTPVALLFSSKLEAALYVEETKGTAK